MSKSNEEPNHHRHRKQHESHPNLAGEHRISDIGQIISLVAFLTLWILDSFVFKFSTVLSKWIPWYILIIFAVPFWIIAGFLAYNGMRVVFGAGSSELTSDIISTGVFRYARHPIYLGSMLVYIGLIISTLSLLSLGLFIFIFVFYNYVANYEEKLLLEKFGKEYKKYQQKVPKWGIGLIRRTKIRKDEQ